LVSCFLINSYSDVPQVIYGVDFLGVREAMKNLTSRGAVDPLMKIELGLNESGMLVIHDAYAYGEVKEESIASRIKGFFGGSSSSTSTTATAEEGEETTIETAPSETPSESSATPEPTSSPASVPVKFELKHTSIVPYSSAQIMAARKRLIAVDNAEKLRNKKEEARNMLEGYSYRMRDLLVGEPTSPFILYSKEEERRKLEERMGEAFALVNEGDDAELAELWRRREEME
jgi:hypoxia up-regulated 1